MRVSSRFLLLTLVLCTLPVLLLGACRRRGDSQPPVATPSITLSRAKAALGSPLEITYKFAVARDAPKFGEDFTVMVHFVDSDEELMWTDDHRPPVPTTQWKPGQRIEYTRTVFVPVYPYLGDAAIQVGLYSSKDARRLALAGEDSGQRAYKVGSLQLLAQTENVFLIYKDGWHPPEVAAENSVVEWQWTKGVAAILFRNPKRDCTFFLHADNPGSAFNEPQNVEIVLNGQPVDRFTLAPRQEHIQRTAVKAAQLGNAEMAEVRIRVDKTYVPALIPAIHSRDPRELGIRVFHAFVEPR
jgi:hypothetical protein